MKNLLEAAENSDEKPSPTVKDGDIFLQAIISGYTNSHLSVKVHYLELLSQLLDSNFEIAIKFFEKLPSLCDILEDVELHTGHPQILQMIVQLSGKLVTLSKLVL